jgi:hypothetical protein
LSQLTNSINVSAIAPNKKSKGKKKVVGGSGNKADDLSSKERYAGFHSANAAFSRYIDTAALIRPSYMPSPIAAFERAQQRGIAHMDMLPNVQGHLSYYVPPVHLFYGCQSPERLTIYATTAVKLLPFFVRRIKLGLQPLSAKRWREILGGEYWNLSCWPKEERSAFDMNGDFWKFGSEEIFGKELSDLIRLGKVPELGKLECGCAPTPDKIQGYGPLIEDIVYGLNQWALLHQLSSISQAALTDAKIPAIKDRARMLYIPDFFERDHSSKQKIIRRILSIVTGGQDIPTSGWPRCWSGPEADDDGERREWLESLRSFFLKFADHRTRFAEMLGWRSARGLSDVVFKELYGDHLDEAQQEYLNRYFLTCLMAGQWPAEFLRRPENEHDYMKCKACRIPFFRALPGQRTADPYDLEDEE